jgi:hypothetical protein
MGEEANTTAVDTHVDRVDGQRRLLDDLALVLRRKDLATNMNEQVLLEGVIADVVVLAMASSIGAVDAEYIDRLSLRVLYSRGVVEG